MNTYIHQLPEATTGKAWLVGQFGTLPSNTNSFQYIFLEVKLLYYHMELNPYNIFIFAFT